MRSHRDCKSLIHLLYFVIRAWLALTTPCVAETLDNLGSGSTQVRGRLDDAILSDKSNWAITDDPKEFPCRCRSAPSPRVSNSVSLGATR